MVFNKEEVLENMNSVLGQYMDGFKDMDCFKLDEFSTEDTLVVIVDMINGFVKYGALSSEYVNDRVPDMSRFVDDCVQKGYKTIAYRDAHTSCSPELNFFPEHCMSGSDESKLIDELKHDEIIEVEKNSTNGFLAANPLELVEYGRNIKNIIVIGCVTDICVRDFAKTMNKHFQEINQVATVYVVENLVDTFHIDGVHNREVEHLLALYDMNSAGIKIVKWEE